MRTLKTLDRDLRWQYVALGLCAAINAALVIANTLAAHRLVAIANGIWAINSVVYLYAIRSQQDTRDLIRVFQAMLEEKARSR
jgi:hypothetical protein